ncbi:PepSY-associated TM helix domain-containing protein [Roseateles chitinivorans]|uniref:PepSY-associated TM helix domain-containing protein n=1 Tax=Roseateles chitinivorans TaxID=2917965 RepID=UPI003D67FF6C
MSTSSASALPDSSLYRRVWRWHFYAGLLCLPILVLMAVTGALYLYKDAIEWRLDAGWRFVPPTSGPGLDGESLVQRALAAQPGSAVRFIPPAVSGRSAEVGVRTYGGVVTVYLDPADGRVLGQQRDDRKLMEVIKRLHSLVIAGPVANHAVEIVAGWAIVLVVSGVFLWWPRGRSGGVYTLRGRTSQRLWWRDLHAVTGAAAAVAILFLAVTGMPWSAFWGKQFGQLTNDWGVGLPKHLWGKPASTPPLSSLGDTPWTLIQAPLPESMAHAGHDTAAPSPDHAAHTKTGRDESSAPSPAPEVMPFGLNQALRLLAAQGLPPGTPVSLPIGPTGVFTAMSMPDDVTQQRVVHLDRYTGQVLADVGYRDYGVVGRAVEWGIQLHTGRQFGGLNQLVMLAGCLSIVGLAVSAVVMWWKRRPRGRFAAPPRRAGDRAAIGAIVVAAALGTLYPLLGASMLAALVLDALVPRRWHERFGL